MTHKYIFPLLLVALLFTACKKEKDVEYFSDTNYHSLGKFDKDGLPDYLLKRDKISSELQNFMSKYMVERRNLVLTHPELFTTSAISEITILNTSTVYIAFAQQATNRNNALGFYTYPTDNPPTSPNDSIIITCAFPNIGVRTPLKPGDKIKLGTFQPGVSIGFVLIVDGWDQQNKIIKKNTTLYYTNDILNPETDPGLKKHAIIIPYPSESKIFIGFEDQGRSVSGSDHDFNDAVIYCTIES